MAEVYIAAPPDTRGRFEVPGGSRGAISVVIPARNEAAGIEATLASVRSQVPPPGEILVVDGGSGDGTPERATAAGARVLRTAPGRGRQLHRGALAARGDRLLFLHADTRLPPGALAAVTRTLDDPAVVGGKFRLGFEHRHPVLDGVSFLSRFRFGWTSFGDAAFFTTREAYRQAGGFETVPLFEDQRFFRSLKRVGPTRVVPLAVTTSCRRFCERGPLRQLARNTGLFLLHQFGVPPGRLARRYL